MPATCFSHFLMARLAQGGKSVVAFKMTFILKTLLHFFQPFPLIWLMLGIWLIRSFMQKHRPGLIVPAMVWLLITILTCTPLSSYLLAGLENELPRVKLSELPQADAIICLGGGAEPGLFEPVGIKLKSAADRLSTALTLAASGKAPILILGGGGFPHDGGLSSEADAVANYIRNHLPLKTDIHSLGICSDTHDEAVKVAAFMQKRGLKQVLLVTSASHMPRSVAVFRKAGVNVIPVPCNYTSSLNRVGDKCWVHLPHADGFNSFDGWLHEMIGIWVYRWRGWV